MPQKPYSLYTKTVLAVCYVLDLYHGDGDCGSSCGGGGGGNNRGGGRKVSFG
jgi:hypothetical protein